MSSDLFNRTAGICGRFSGNNNDDKIGRDGLGKDSLHKLAQSWVEDQDCVVGSITPAPSCEKVNDAICLSCWTFLIIYNSSTFFY